MNVTRRGFGGTVIGAAAALLLPKLQIRPQYDLHAIAKGWCDRQIAGTSRWDLSAPYLKDGNVYATDARAMVRFVDDAATSFGEMRVPRNTVAVFDEFWHPTGKWNPLPINPVTLGQEESCPACLSLVGECPTCGGDGYIATSLNDTEDEFRSCKCPSCKGDGYLRDKSCRWCEGDRTRKVPSIIVLDSNLLGVEYYERILRLPGATWQPGRCSESPLMIQSDIGISGLVMQRSGA